MICLSASGKLAYNNASGLQATLRANNNNIKPHSQVTAMLSAEMFDNAEKASKLLKVIAHPHRLMILCLLLDGKKNVTELTDAVGISQTAMSNHLARLRSEHIVDFTRYHRSLVYELTSPQVQPIIGTLYQIYCASDAAAIN